MSDIIMPWLRLSLYLQSSVFGYFYRTIFYIIGMIFKNEKKINGAKDALSRT